MMRRRSDKDYHDNSTEDSVDTSEKIPFLSGMSGKSAIDFQEVMALEPVKVGFGMKINNSWLAYLLPCFYARWKKRCFVLIGGFLYRFDHGKGDKLKGVPIPIDSSTFELGQDGEFVVNMIRKRYLIRVESQEEARIWVDKLKERKQMAIKENMGHSTLRAEIKRLNAKALGLFDRKLKSEENEMKDSVTNPLFSSN